MIDRPPQLEHERYEEFCALATAGALTAAESEALFLHFDECADCRTNLAEYQSLAGEAMPLLIDLHRRTPDADGFDESYALTRLLKSAGSAQPDAPRVALSHPLSWKRWHNAIAATLIIGVVLASYKLGEFRRRNSMEQSNVSIPSVLSAANVTRERQSLEASLEDSRRREADLQTIASERGSELEKLRADAKLAQQRLDVLNASLTTTKADDASQVQALAAQRDASAVKFQEAERLSLNAQNELNALRAQREQDLVRISSLESQVSGFTVAMNEEGRRAKDDEQYLASDKDIRDLIGARNLYIADIMDVREDGSARKPFGRVFYTKTKSLIFYAYDLDQQPGVKRASTFHVWGRTGADDRKPLSLGILYLDSESNRRWTLRVDNPEQLARLDAVFVTVEPREQIDKPTGKPFLYASLRREPNHP